MTRAQRLRVELPAVIALGSNLGDREQNLRDAVAAIAATDSVRVLAASGMVESAAVKPDGVDESAPSYLNAVIRIRTALSPEGLLDELNRIERALGRVRDVRWGDRTIDLDIIMFAGASRQTDRLTLPHPRAADRPFVIVPWLQVQPSAELPGRGPIADLPAAASSGVRPFDAAALLESARA